MAVTEEEFETLRCLLQKYFQNEIELYLNFYKSIFKNEDKVQYSCFNFLISIDPESRCNIFDLMKKSLTDEIIWVFILEEEVPADYRFR